MSASAEEVQKANRRAPSRENWPTEGKVLARVLEQHPRRVSVEELAREVEPEGVPDPTLERAIDNLAAARFVLREGSDLVVAPAVIDFDRLASAQPEVS